MKKLPLLSLLVYTIFALFTSCISHPDTLPDDNAVVIDLTASWDSTCLLSDLADSIVYYPLATEYKGVNFDVEILSQTIWTYNNIDINMSEGHLYDRETGNLINRVPFNHRFGGMDTLMDYRIFDLSTHFSLDDDNLLLSPASKLKGVKRYQYSIPIHASTGKHLDNIAFPYGYGWNYMRLNDSLVLRKQAMSIDVLPSYYLNWYTIQLDSLKQDVFPDSVFQTSMSWNNTKVHLLHDKIYFHFPIMKTIYEISPHHEPIALYRYKLGKYEPPYSRIKNLDKYWELESQGKLPYINIRTSLMAKNYVFGGFNYKGLIHRVLVDRHTNRVYILPTNSASERKSVEGIPNDLDGGLDFWPKRISKYGEIYSWYNVKDLKEKVSQSHSGAMKNPEAAKRLKELLDNLPEEVNVIVAVLKEKSK